MLSIGIYTFYHQDKYAPCYSLWMHNDKQKTSLRLNLNESGNQSELSCRLWATEKETVRVNTACFAEIEHWYTFKLHCGYEYTRLCMINRTWGRKQL